MTAPTLTPVVLNLGIREYLPDDADLPTAARKAVHAWAQAQADLQQAERDVQAAIAAHNDVTTFNARKEAETRALALGDPVVWPERDALKEAMERKDRLHQLVQVLHDDAARAIKEAAPAARESVEGKNMPAALKGVQDAVDAVEKALRRLQEVGALRAYWEGVIGSHGGGGARANIQVTTAGIVVDDALRGRPTRGVNELIAPLRGIVGTR